MRVVIPLPDRDFDTTEVAVPWRLFFSASSVQTAEPRAFAERLARA